MPIPPIADPKAPVLATKADNANIARLANTPTIPMIIARIASRVTPKGRDGLGCMVVVSFHPGTVKQTVTKHSFTSAVLP